MTIADLVFLNGEVVTVDERNTIAEAVAVEGNRIKAVGTNEEVKVFIGEKTKVIDLEGKSLLPGFIDSHLHLTMYGVNQQAVNCKADHIKSLEDILSDLRDKAKETPKGQWVRAWGFNETKIKEKRYPTKEELDHISSEHPILILRTCGHISIVNSKALEIAKIDRTTPDPEGGFIERDVDGNTTGRLVETANMAMNEIASYTEEELRKGMKTASDHFISSGITSVHDAGVLDTDNFRIMQQAVQAKDIRVRVYAVICTLNDSARFVDNIMSAGIVTGLGDEFFKIGPAKVFTDGSSTGPTIATRQPYTSDSKNFGILYYSQEELDRILGEAHKKGYQITAHAQGDRAIEMVLNCIEKALDEQPRKNHRHRIEHAGIASADLQERMKKLGVIPIPNPPFFYEFGESYVKNYGSRVNEMYPLRDYIDNGIIAAAGSDCPVTHYDPLFGIHVAVNRKTASGQLVGGRQRVGVVEAIRAYTWNGAYASFEEDMKGSIEKGKLADLVILDSSILSADPENIKDLSVHMTIIDGEVVFQKQSRPVSSSKG
ncbi:amidohydrolase [Priestia abyssalis]|uniref:amidohydrolase n=1 Tax=Priestia abyssalis TaxID=1221450 RepID=UPI000994A881|nr:amidohydrolase [Priestia abyssalis]